MRLGDVYFIHKLQRSKRLHTRRPPVHTATKGLSNGPHRVDDSNSLSRCNDTGLPSTLIEQSSVNPNQPSTLSLAASSTSPVREPLSTRNRNVKCGTTVPLTEILKGNTMTPQSNTHSCENRSALSIEQLAAFFTINPTALDMVSFDFAQEPSTCGIESCESDVEFFVFDPTTNHEVAHICLNCFEQATNGASGGTAAYFTRFESILSESEL